MKRLKKIIKHALQNVTEKILRRECESCIYNSGFLCYRNDEKGIDCHDKIIPVGWKGKTNGKR